MAVWFWLAPAVSHLASAEAEAKGFGLNFDILETNLVNLSIVIGLIVYAGRNFLGQQLSDRRSGIETELQAAEARLKDASAALDKQQKLLAEAKQEAEKIVADAKLGAEKTRAVILEQATADVARLKASAVQDLNAEQQRAVEELRQRAVALALQKVEGELPNRLNDGVQQQLVDRSIALIGG